MADEQVESMVGGTTFFRRRVI